MTDSPKKILLVDDDQFLLDLYARKFEAGGFVVSKAKSADEALELLKGGLNPVVIAFDIVMPGTDGFAFLEMLQREGIGKGILKIALSNEAEGNDIERIKALGADAHITKASAIPSEIVTQIMQIIGAHRAS